MNANSSVDYTRPDTWNWLAAVLETLIDLQPTANCGRVLCEPGWHWRPRLLDYDLWLAVKGRGVMCIGDQRYPIQPGTLFFLRPGDSGWATQDPDDRLTVVYLHVEIITSPDGLPGDRAWLPSRWIAFADPASIEQLLTRAVRLQELRQPLATVEAGLIVRQALIAIYQQDALNQGVTTTRRDRRVEQVIAYLRSHTDQRISLADAAALVDLAPGYFSRLFTQATGLSFRAFTLQVRLERARTLLEETTMPIGQIAHALGYADVFLFSRQFKQQYGLSPSQARKKQ
ncbi:MAG TPA: AraC family transcriptional regulator [Roseiflexaceae bacterium]|nr:AraC family transcriptional regulator [Roseiflexaceae bacterium]